MKARFIAFLMILAQAVSAQYTNTLVIEARRLLSEDKFVAALSKLNDAIRVNNFDYEAYFFRGYTKFNLGDIAGAEKDYSESIELYPYSVDALHYRALARERLYDFQGAFDDFAKAIKLAPKRNEIYLNRAIMDLFLQHHQDAVDDCNTVLERDKKEDNAYVIRGSAKAGMKKREEAITDFNTAIGLDSTNVNAFIQRGLVWMDSLQYDNALQDFNTAIALDADSALPLYYRALVEIETNNYEAAFRDLNQVIEMSPYNTPAYFNRAILKSKTGDKKGAIEDFDKVLSLNPENIVSLFNRAGLKYGLKDLQGALKDYTAAIKLFPDFGDAYYNRSLVRRALKDWEGAEADFIKANEINENNYTKSDTLKSLEGEALRKLIALNGDFEGAKQADSKIQYQYVAIDLRGFFRVCLQKDSTGVRFYDVFKKDHYYASIVKVINTKNDLNYEQAQDRIDQLSRMIQDEPDNAEHYYHRGTYYVALQNYKAGFKDYNKAIALDNDYTLAYFQRANAWLELLELTRSFSDFQGDMSSTMKTFSYDGEEINIDEAYNKVVLDYNKTITLDTAFAYAYYNRAYVRCIYKDYTGAVTDFNRAIRYEPELAEGYYNSGLTLIYLEQRDKGCANLSKAGELGIVGAYNVMKRYCNQ